VNRRLQLKQKQLKADRQQLDNLIAEDDAITQQLGYETNAAERLRLERQQEDCRVRMDKLAEKCDRLEAELQEVQAKDEALQTLVNLLSLVQLEILMKIYRDCLVEGRSRSIPDTVEGLVQQLADFPGEKLLQFVSLLMQEPIEQKDALKTWATKQGMALPKELIQMTEVCLMIRVKPRRINDSYIVEAAISQDPDPWNPEIEPIRTPLKISLSPNPQLAPGYAQEDLPKILDELITTCGTKYKIALSDLVIQWFLPIELMSLPLEHWQIQIGRIQKQSNGIRCKAVIVRSCERRDYELASGDWHKYWKRLLEFRESRCSETLVLLDPITRRTTINWKKTKVIGCKFVEHHEVQKQAELWDALLGQGLPVALWMRHCQRDPEKTRKALQTVAKCSIAQLSDSLAGHRQKALSHDCETDRLEAASLCLLLDNPFRPFPTIDYYSA
jgi:hypothetical protein